MSVEDDDIAWIKRELEELSKRAKTSDELGAVMIERLAAGYEDRVATERIESVPHDSILVHWFRKALHLPIRRDPHDLLSKAFIDSLEVRGDLTKQKKRVIANYRVVLFAKDGATRVVLPPQSAYRRATRMMLVLSILAMGAAGLAWEVFSTGLVDIAICWTIGALLGWIARDTYDSAWGRERIARALAARHRWLKISLT